MGCGNGYASYLAKKDSTDSDEAASPDLKRKVIPEDYVAKDFPNLHSSNLFFALR